MENAIEIVHVTKKFKETVAVNGVTVSLERGKIHGIIGRNGSGKTVLFQCICGLFPVTLIFDEVDTGVSGRAAQKVAEKLRSVARNKQVLCVTLLPQIAALADTHLLIAKGEGDGRTYTTVTPLDREGRKLELARIIGGASITEITLKSAEEMLTSGV